MNNPAIRLYDLMLQNTALRFKNIIGQSFTLKELIYDDKMPDGRQLAFLYLDHSLSSLAVLLNFIKSDHVIALFSPKLSIEFKNKLEAQYQPSIIFDSERKSIDTYAIQLFHKESFFFIKEDQSPLNTFHPKLKLLLSTSGSTGSPKLVKLSEQNLIENALAIINYLPITTTDVCPLTLPLYYAYGLSILTTNAIAGAEIICECQHFLQASFWEAFQQFGFTSLAGVPHFYETLNSLHFTSRKFPSLRYLTQAGGKLNALLIEKFALYALNNNIEFFTMYGQTEATARMSYVASEQLLNKIGSIGKVIKNGSFRIDATSQELLYSGPNVFGGYCQEPSDLQHFDPPAVLHTGDLAQMDADGYYYIIGRIKRMLKLAGIRYQLDEIEQLLKMEFPSNECYCIGIEDKELWVFIKNKVKDAHKIKTVIFSKTSIHPTMIKLFIIDNIPLTINGKIDYVALSSMKSNLILK